MIPSQTLILFALIAAVGIVAVTAIEIWQEALAAGCKSGIPFNASKGRCFGH